MTRPGIEPRSPGQLVNTLSTWPIMKEKKEETRNEDQNKRWKNTEWELKAVQWTFSSYIFKNISKNIKWE